MHKPSKNSF